MRDFEKEYKNYIQEDVPDLWDRIEAGIPEKTPGGSNKLLYFVKHSMPVAAALCVLIIGIGVIRISNRAKSENAAYESATVTEDAHDEAPAAECEAFVVEDDFTEEEAAEVLEAAKNTEIMSDEAAGDEAAAGIQAYDAASSKENENTLMTDADGIVTIHAATLTGISMADSDLQDEGFAYVYRFVLDNGNRMEMYLTREQCDALEADGILVERQKQYELEVRPYALGETDSGANTSAKCVLVNMRED